MKRTIIILFSIILLGATAKAQQMSDTLKIYFRQGRSVYEPAYRENSARASVFFDRINAFQKSSSLFSILDVTYRAGASPEGSVKGNMALSSRRCSTITDMLHGHLDFPESVVGIEDVSEDWDGLTEMVLRSRMPYRDEVLEILWGGVGSRKAELERLHEGYVWKYLNKEFFPELRAFTIIIKVGVRNPELEIPEIPDSEVNADDDFVQLDASAPLFGTMQMPRPAPAPREWQRKLRIKTNAVGWAMFMSNAAVEVDITRNLSFSLPIYYSALDYFSRELKFRTFAVQPEIRWWFGRPEGLFLGAHFGTAYFNYATKGDWRIQTGYGDRPLWGGGVAAGYRMPLVKRNPRWEVEFTLGAGVYDVYYDRFYNEKNGPKEGTYHTTFIGIDNAAVTFSYSFGLKKRRDR